MSTFAIQGRISSVQHRIESLHRQLTQRSREEASKNQQIADLSRSMARCTSVATVQSKQRQAQRLQDEILRLQRNKADITKQIAEETAKLHKHQEALYKEQGREQQEFQKSLERRERDERRRQRSLLKQLTPNAMQDPESEESRQLERTMEYDAFISHASEDKVDLVVGQGDEMIDLPYSLVIEATDEPDYFGFYSPELEGFSGIGHSVEDCMYKAKWGMQEHVAILTDENLPLPPRNDNPTIVIQNEAQPSVA